MKLVAFIDGGLTTAKNLVKDLANVLSSGNRELSPQIVDEVQIVELDGTDLKVTMNYKLLDETATFVDVLTNTPVVATFTSLGNEIIFTDDPAVVTDGQELKITYNGHRDWDVVYPKARTVDDDLNQLDTPEKVRLDQLSRIEHDIFDRVVLKTTTTPTILDPLNDPFNTDPNNTTKQLTMYLEIKKPKFAVNPETGSSSFTSIEGNVVSQVSMINNHYINLRIIDFFDEVTGEAAGNASPSEWAKFSWLVDFKESLIDDYDGTPTTGLLTNGYFLRPIKIPEYYDSGLLAIEYSINTNNDRVHIVLMGNPDVSPDNYLTSYAYVGRIDLFKDKITNKPFFNDVVGNFAITAGSATIPSKPIPELVEYVGNDAVLTWENNQDLWHYVSGQIQGTSGTSAYFTLSVAPVEYDSMYVAVRTVQSGLIFNWKKLTVGTGINNYSIDASNPEEVRINIIENSISPGREYRIAYKIATKFGRVGKTLEPGVATTYTSGSVGALITQNVGTISTAYKVSFLTNQIETKPMYIPVVLYNKVFVTVTEGNNPQGRKEPTWKTTTEGEFFEAPPLFQGSTDCFVPEIRIQFPAQLKQYIKGVRIYKFNFKSTAGVQLQFDNAEWSSQYNEVPVGIPKDDDATNRYRATTAEPYNIIVDQDDLDAGFVVWPDTSYRGTPLNEYPAPLAERRLDITEPGIIRDPLTKRIVKVAYADTYGARTTANGVSDIAMYKTKGGTVFQKHSAAFVTQDEFLSKAGFSPSKWTKKYHLSNIYIVHNGDGYRGMFSDVVVVDNSNIVNGDVLVVNEGSTDPQNPEVRYKYFRINAPYKFMDSSPNYSVGIAIKME